MDRPIDRDLIKTIQQVRRIQCNREGNGHNYVPTVTGGGRTFPETVVIGALSNIQEGLLVGQESSLAVHIDRKEG